MTRNTTIKQTTLQATVGDVVPVGDIYIEESDQPVDVSSRTYTAQVRPQAGADTAVDITIDDTDAAAGHLVLSVDLTDPEVTAGTWWWDIVEEQPGGRVETIEGGPFIIGPRITEVGA